MSRGKVLCAAFLLLAVNTVAVADTTISFSLYNRPSYSQPADRTNVTYTDSIQGSYQIPSCAEAGCMSSVPVAYGSAWSNAGNLTMGTTAGANSLGASTYDTHSTVSVDVMNSFTVNAGTSGLQQGSAVDLNWLQSIEGTLSATGTSFYNSGQATIGAYGEIKNGGSQVVYFYLFGELLNEGAPNFNTQWYYLSNLYTSPTYNSSGNAAVLDLTKNLGTDGLLFRAYVGQSYEVSLHLSATAAAYGNNATAESDFSHTATSGLTSSVDGVDLAWAVGNGPSQPGNTAPVPETDTVFLLGSGMALFIRRGWKR